MHPNDTGVMSQENEQYATPPNDTPRFDAFVHELVLIRWFGRRGQIGAV
jgi:hypothetical protein